LKGNITGGVKMSDSNRTGIYYIEEVTWGETPASALQELRITGESLGFVIDHMVSGEIRDDRQITDLVQTGAECNGGFNFELSYGTFDELFEGALWNSWSTTVAVDGSDISVTAATSTYASAAIEDFVADGIVVGQWLKFGGFTNSENNGIKKVTSVTTLTVVVDDAGLVDESAPASATLDGAYLRNGTEEHSYSIERKHADITEFFGFLGMVVNTLELTIAANAAVTGTIEFQGKSASLAQSTIGTGGPTDATTTEVFNALSNVGSIEEGGSALSLMIQEITISIANNVRGIPAVGTLGAADIGVGKCDITGTLNVMFADDTLYDKYLANTATSLSFQLTDAAGNVYIFTIPNIKFESDQPNAEGQDSDVVENITWRAMRDSTTDCMIQIDRIAA